MLIDGIIPFTSHRQSTKRDSPVETVAHVIDLVRLQTQFAV